MSYDNTSQGQFCWNELITSDTKKAKTFYSELFGWTCVEQDMGYTLYTIFKNGQTDVGGMFQTPDPSIPSHWLNYIAVDDLDAMVEKAAKLGAKIKMPVTPVSDFGKFAVLEDPTGAHFALWKSLKVCENS